MFGLVLFVATLIFGGGPQNRENTEASGSSPSATVTTSPAAPLQTQEPRDDDPQDGGTATAPQPEPLNEGDVLSLTGVVESNTCIVVPHGVTCSVEGVNFDDLGLARLSAGGYLVVECDADGCVSRRGSQAELPCTEYENAVFCVQVPDRAGFYSILQRFASGCRDLSAINGGGASRWINCTLRDGIELSREGLRLFGVPIRVAWLPEGGSYNFAAYAGEAWTAASSVGCAANNERSPNAIRCA
jgi:hypothetical protein